MLFLNSSRPHPRFILANRDMMRAALVTSWGSPPTYTTTADLPPPSPTQIRLRVLAAGVHRLVLARAAGTHYTSTTLPHLPGADGVGEDPTTGRRYYFSALATGSFAEFVNVERAMLAPLPETQTADADADAVAVAVAAYTNPVMSSWMALAARTGTAPTTAAGAGAGAGAGTVREPGFSVVILGVTSASGRVAVDVARSKGAGRVVGIARNAAAMAEMELDERI
ncbi:hypothetical protein CTA2_12690, partial [Colletotrichum tanaceti]